VLKDGFPGSAKLREALLPGKVKPAAKCSPRENILEQNGPGPTLKILNVWKKDTRRSGIYDRKCYGIWTYCNWI